MASPFSVSLRRALELVASATPIDPGEAAVARRIAREIEHDLGRLERGESCETDLIAIVCHDLKDPLASVMMGVGFLLKTIPVDEGAARRVVEAIARSTERMSQVVGDFHDLSKLEAGRVALDVRPQDIVAILRPVASSFEAKARERGVELAIEMPQTPLVALCDRTRLPQVVSKLVGNAIKFTNAGGRVVLRAEQRAGRARIAVADSGRGIPADRLATIFDHAVNARRTPRDGPGLGLAIAQGLLRLQEGKIEVESRVDQGSEFSFTLPM
jgi:signal transduction histidine kinase